MKMYVYNKVTSFMRLIEWTIGHTDNIPIYHIPCNCNLADVLTKHHNI